MPRAHWTPSPCGRLSRPPRWRVTATTTTGPPPRPGGNSERCACPKPTNSGSAGTAGTLPTFTHMPVGRVGAQLYPGDIAARYRNPARGLASPSKDRTDETVPSEQRDRASQQPIAASFGAAVLYRGFNHWYRFPCAFLPCERTRPAGGGPFLRCRGPLAAQRRTSGAGAALQLQPAVTAAGGEVSHPARSYGASWRRLAPDDMQERYAAPESSDIAQAHEPTWRGWKTTSLACAMREPREHWSGAAGVCFGKGSDVRSRQ